MENKTAHQPSPLDSSQLAANLVSLLINDAPDGHTAALSSRAVDWLLEEPIGALVDANVLAGDLVDLLAGREGLAATLDRHLETIVSKERQRVEETGETLALAVPEHIVGEIADRLGRKPGLPRGFGRDIVDAAFIRELITRSLTETLESFLTRLPLFGGSSEGGGGDSGLLGRVARKGASRLKTAGSVLSGIGSGVQDNLKRQAREFAAQSADRLRQGIVDRFISKENRGALDAMRRRAVEAVLALEVIDLHRMADDPGVETSRRWVEDLIAHNLARPEIRAALTEQVKDAIGRDADRTLGMWLADHGMLQQVRDHLVEEVTRQLSKFMGTEGFRAWLEQTLNDALAS